MHEHFSSERHVDHEWMRSAPLQPTRTRSGWMQSLHGHSTPLQLPPADPAEGDEAADSADADEVGMDAITSWPSRSLHWTLDGGTALLNDLQKTSS